MASLINELIYVLEEQNKVYQELLEISSKKKLSIIENDITKLQTFISKENTLVGKSQRLDKKRIQLFKDIAFVLNKPNQINLSLIIEMIKGQSEEEQLIKIKNKTIELLNKLKIINDQNKELIEISLEHIEVSMNFIRSSVNSEPYFYDSQGNEINHSNKKLFDATQ